MLSLATKLRNLKVHPETAHEQRPPNGAVHAQLYLCLRRNRLASVCIEHGIFESRSSNRVVTVALHRLSPTTKETIFRRSAVSRANSSNHVNKTTPDGAVCNMASLEASCGANWIHLGGWD